MSTIAAVIGRILLSLMFIVAGLGKLMDVGGTEAMLAGANLPAGLAIPTGLFEIVGGLCLAFGMMTRLVSLLLAGFTGLATLFYHHQFTDPMQAAMAMKNIAIVGGLLLVFAHSQMWWSWDHMRRERRDNLAARGAEARAHEAELRAVRAEVAARNAPVTGQTRVAGKTMVTDVDGDGVPEVRKRRWF